MDEILHLAMHMIEDITHNKSWLNCPFDSGQYIKSILRVPIFYGILD